MAEVESSSTRLVQPQGDGFSPPIPLGSLPAAVYCQVSATADRPAPATVPRGWMLFDSDLGVPIWRGTVLGTPAWVDATGALV